MKTTLFTTLAAVACSFSLFAADGPSGSDPSSEATPADKPAVTIPAEPGSDVKVDPTVAELEGDLQCGKCSLGVDEECTTVIVVPAGEDKIDTYYVDGPGAQGFHKEICTKIKPGKVTGVVTEVDGKKTVTIENAPELKTEEPAKEEVKG